MVQSDRRPAGAIAYIETTARRRPFRMGTSMTSARTPGRPAWIVLSLFLAMTPAAHAQGTRADYERADRLRARTVNKVVKVGVRPNWSADGSRFWYRNDLAAGAREFIAVDAERGERKPAFDHAKLAEALSEAVHSELRRDPPALRSDRGLRRDLDHRRGRRARPGGSIKARARSSQVGAGQERTRREGRAAPPANGAGRSPSLRGDVSPDGHWKAIVKDHNVFLRETRLRRRVRAQRRRQRGRWLRGRRLLVARLEDRSSP